MAAVLGPATGPARHLELFVPSVPLGGPLWRELGSAAASSAAPPPAGPALVTRLDQERFGAGTRGGGFAVQTLADHTQGVGGAVVNAAQVAAGGAGPPLHIHRFDQLFVVLEGELQVSVAGQQVLARRHDVVVLPAGVAHTQWNAGERTEVHLAILVPPPAPGAALTEPVEFRLLG